MMLVAITPRQWRGLLQALGIAGAVAALEAQFGVSFADDEGLRFTHRAPLYALIERALAEKRPRRPRPGLRGRRRLLGPLPAPRTGPRRHTPLRRQPPVQRPRPPQRRALSRPRLRRHDPRRHAAAGPARSTARRTHRRSADRSAGAVVHGDRPTTRRRLGWVATKHVALLAPWGSPPCAPSTTPSFGGSVPLAPLRGGGVSALHSSPASMRGRWRGALSRAVTEGAQGGHHDDSRLSECRIAARPPPETDPYRWRRSGPIPRRSPLAAVAGLRLWSAPLPAGR